MKKMNGITLIALVITIIVLLILAGVSIAMLTGDNGILTQAQRAKTQTEQAQADEKNILANYESYLNSYSGENTEFTDSLGNKLVVPAGFRVVNSEDNVEDGIIIEDVTHGATAGSQFVWIPVGTGIKKKDGTTFDIKLSRYKFEENGETPLEEPIDKGQDMISDAFKEVNIGNGNATAKENIETEEEGFRKSVIENGGYYIGRYEARTDIERNNKEDKLTQISEEPNDFVYNFVTQLQASELSRNMYSNSGFESDLINSYAWDTAILFIQTCSENKGYSLQKSLNSTLATKGTNNEELKDEVCNIFDMASNCWEWSTETSYVQGNPCVNRGGFYWEGLNFASYRAPNFPEHPLKGYSFRPIIYLK